MIIGFCDLKQLIHPSIEALAPNPPRFSCGAKISVGRPIPRHKMIWSSNRGILWLIHTFQVVD